MRTILVFTLLVVAVNCRAISKNTDEKSKKPKKTEPKLMIGYPLFKKEDLDSQGYALFRKDDSQGYALFRKDDSQGYALFRKDAQSENPSNIGHPLFKKEAQNENSLVYGNPLFKKEEQDGELSEKADTPLFKKEQDDDSEKSEAKNVVSWFSQRDTRKQGFIPFKRGQKRLSYIPNSNPFKKIFLGDLSSRSEKMA